MDNYLKHNMIFYAMSICIAVIAAYESTWLLLLLLFFSSFLYYKRISYKQISFIVAAALLFFIYTERTIQKLAMPIELPAMMTLTAEYKINGAMLRGFMKTEDGRKVYVTYEVQSAVEKVALSSNSLAGRRFWVEGQLVSTAKPAHAYSFSMADYLKSKGAQGIVEVEKLVEAGFAQSVSSALAKQRFHVKRHIATHFPGSLVAEAQALIIGVQENVDEDLTRAYQKLGITHLFAISGLHVALISLLFYQALLRLGVRRELATIMLLIILPMYALLAGGAPSVWRAVAVVELVLIAKYVRLKLAIDDSLSISFIVFVALQPGAIYQIGLQLSYLATASLIYSSTILQRQPNMWMQSFMMTVVCQLLVYPLLLLHFYELSLSSFLANVIFVPLFSFIILPINVILLIISYIVPSLFLFLVAMYEPLRILLTEIIMYLQSLPYQMWVPGKPNTWWMVILYGSVFVTLYFLDCRRPVGVTVSILLIPALLFHLSQQLQRDVHITFLHVGQGDSILIELPYRRGTYLIDTGGVLRFAQQEEWKERNSTYEVGTQIVVPFLKGKGISKLDVLILTHADADHVEAAEEVVREIRMREIHITPNSAEKEVMFPLLAEASKKRVKIVEKVQGDAWKIGGVQFAYLWPADEVYEGNNDSLVLLMQINQWKGLFTGDLEEEGELALIQQFGKELANIQLLKAGHHGSRTSSSEAFIEHTKPRLTIFMAGENNRYGHPHNEVTKRFQKRKLPYFITGKDGTIGVVVRNGKMFVHFDQ